ncbi:pilus assembly protein TadG-related protein [Streptomyces sp. NPDC049954]|uniref:pilus assembly protein TadG-related protein n=1 Tax=Streptomyces sp. NPDC049954 TaxID=3155779 RepID=UPI003428B6A5
MRCRPKDEGQVLPLYVWAAGAVLFAAFAFFAFAQAAVARNSAQSAADAAALAAAQEGRDELMHNFIAVIDGAPLQDWLTGSGITGTGAQQAAQSLAAFNNSKVTAVRAVEVDGAPGFRVAVQSLKSVGHTLVPGTEGKFAEAHATAVIQPRCAADDAEEDADSLSFTCTGGRSFSFDPEKFDPQDLPDSSTLFAVHLAE